MKDNTNLYFILLIGIIVVMGYFMFFSTTSNPVVEFDEASLREEIRLSDSTSLHWEQEAISWQTIASTAGNKSDSLEKFKPVIKIYYHEKYTFNANADLLQLDSVIRANW
jgi:hypothetical protein